MSTESALSFSSPATLDVERACADWWVRAWELRAALAYAPDAITVDAADARAWFRAGGHCWLAWQRRRRAIAEQDRRAHAAFGYL